MPHEMVLRRQVAAMAREAAQTTVPLDNRTVVQHGLDLAASLTDNLAQQERLTVLYTTEFLASMQQRVADVGPARYFVGGND